MPGNLSEGTSARQAQGEILCVAMSAWASVHGKLAWESIVKLRPGISVRDVSAWDGARWHAAEAHGLRDVIVHQGAHPQ